MGQREYTDRISLNPPFGAPGPGRVDIYATAGDPNGVISATQGDRAYQVSSNNVWVCAGGTVWVLQTATTEQYTTGATAAWATPLPTTVSAALDRIATYARAIDTTLGNASVTGFPIGPIP